MGTRNPNNYGCAQADVARATLEEFARALNRGVKVPDAQKLLMERLLGSSNLRKVIESDEVSSLEKLAARAILDRE